MPTRATLRGAVFLLAATTATAQTPSAPWIATSEPITILSANDGWTHARLTGDPTLTRDTENLTADSITVVHLGPDHPPIVKTVYGTVPNSILSAPYIAMTGDGRYGFVPSMAISAFGHAQPDPAADLISVVDLASEDLSVVQTLEVPINSNMLVMHPDGEHLLAQTAVGFGVYAMDRGRLELVRANRGDITLLDGAYDISPQGDRIVAWGRGPSDPENHRGVHVFSFEDGVVEHLAEVGVRDGLPRFHVDVHGVPEGIEFTPDGSQLFVQLTAAHQLAVFNVEGFLLKKHPFSIRVGHGPALMALGRRYGSR